MSDSVLRQRTNLFGIAAMITIGALGAAAPASARGLVADAEAMTVVGACALDSTPCSPVVLGTGATKYDVYVYTDGIVSIGSALTAVPTSLLDLTGTNYIAAALADYSGVGITVSEAHFDNFNNFPPGDDSLRIDWVFRGVGQSFDTAFSVDLSVDTPTNALYGAVHYGYFSEEGMVTNTPGGCTTCGGGFTPDEFVGDYLLPGSLIGSSYDATVIAYDTPLPSTGTVSAVPEPEALPVMAFGLGAMAVAMRLSRRRVRVRARG